MQRTRTTCASSAQFADYLARRLTFRALRRHPSTDGHQMNAIGREMRQRILTSPAFRRREAEAKAARQAEGRVIRQRLAEERAKREAGADRVSCCSKAEILAALASRREGVRLVIEFAGTGGRWNLSPAAGDDFRRSQARLRTALNKTSDRALFQGLPPKAGAAVPSARGWRALFAEFCADAEFNNALQLADDAGAPIVFGVNDGAFRGYARPFPYEVVDQLGDGFAVVRALYYGPRVAAGQFRVLSIPHGLTVPGEFKLQDDARANFEKLRDKAMDAARRLPPNDQAELRAQFLAGAADQVQP